MQLITSLIKLYTNLSSNLEKFFLFREIKKKSTLINEGYEFVNLIKNYNIDNFIEKEISENKYFHKKIIKKNSFKQLIELILFENNIADYISDVTGYNFSVDFALAYTTLHIENENQNESIYANLWHRDKPFSKNTLKLILPLHKIDNNSGPMEIINKINSSILTDTNVNKIKNHSYAKVIGDKNISFLFNPNICFHRAGIPNKGKTRSQLMLQLNPSKNWVCSSSLYSKQFKKEPKFPLLNIFDKKIKLND